MVINHECNKFVGWNGPERRKVELGRPVANLSDMQSNLAPSNNKSDNKNNNDHVTIQIADFYSRFVQEDQLFDSAALRANIAELVQVEKQYNSNLGVEQVRVLEATRRDAGIGVSGVLVLFDIQGNLVVNLAHSTSPVPNRTKYRKP